MAEQVLSLTGSPLSQESRQTIAGSSGVSSQRIRGANLLSPVTPSETEIRSLQISQQNQASLVDVQSGLTLIRQDINGLNTGLISISTLLQQDAVSEERNLRTQQENERRLAEEQIRLGKESEIERKIQSAIVAPVEKIAPKVQNLFGNVIESLAYLFGGWLTKQTIDYIKIEGEGNNEKLNDIKSNIIRNLGIAGGVLVAIKFGFTALKKSLIGAISQVAGLLGKTVAAPFNAIRGLVTPGGLKPSGTSAPPKPSGGGLGGAVRSMASGAGNFLKGLAAPLLVGSAMTGLDIASGEDPNRAVAGATTGMIGSAAAFTVGSLLPIPGSGVVSSAVAYNPSVEFGKGLYDKFFGKEQQQVQPETKSSQPLSVQESRSEVQPAQPLILSSNAQPIIEQKTEALKPSPQQEMVQEPNIDFSDYSNIFNLSTDNTFVSPNFSIERPIENEIRPNQLMLPQSNELSFNPSSMFKAESPNNFFDNYNTLVAEEKNLNNPSIIQPAQIQSIPTQTSRVGELPEPKPNIIYASSNSSQQQGPQMNQTPTNGPLTDVPLIRPSNPDNFYTLYSYSCYNVVV